MPARKIPKNYRSSTGIFQSYKNNLSIAYESLLERDFYLLLEFNQEVVAYEEQPFTIRYLRNNATYKYTPDCLVYFHASNKKLPCVFEIKYSSELKEKKAFFEEKFNQVEQYLLENDMDFKMFTELDVDPTYLANAKLLYSYANLQNQRLLSSILEISSKYGELSLNALLNHISTDRYIQAENLPYIWHLVFQNKLKIDMFSPINNQTMVGLSNA
ncbi:heteromeric transposase endonuclease subunit TnsA [Sulfurospirillum sp. UCH001]|uniref:heteromeric transposase endonuclease subunit TnsA n=1 Tax=Sulfurospirillum sp. UCH001 TaxID=1581011 RepID=UPI00082B1172|nr:heteromeric transposase endonuclease subunit TnsA [Sulfurospirillum sp. UCH001]